LANASFYSCGIGFVFLTSFAAGMAQNYEQLLIFRAIGGFGSSMFSVAAGSILLRAVADHQRARAQSLYNGSFLVGMMAGPVVGGALSGFSLPRTTFDLWISAHRCKRIRGCITSQFRVSSKTHEERRT
jgi:MFS family permease